MKINAKKVTLFVPCLVDRLYPEVGEAMVTLLKRLGVVMDCPTDQTCCGQPVFNAGFRKEAQLAAKRFIRLFQESECIVCPSGSCVHMVTHQYPELFKNEPVWREKAIRLGTKTFELTHYLVDVLGVVDVGASFQGKMTYHDSCHLLRGLGIMEQPRKLLRSIKAVDFIEMKNSDRCCGFGGSFAVKYPEISTAILEEKVDHIVETGAEVVVGGDMGCLMNIEGLLSRRKLPIKTMHIAQVLAEEKREGTDTK
jgi:L-lactate dehydrogenase complex protein LldE